MLRIFFQYISLLNRIRIAKMQGYEGLRVSSIYPINRKKLEKKDILYMIQTFFVIVTV